MSRERWLRRGDETVPFDRAQARLASELGVPPDLAHALYVHATQRVRDAADTEALYLRYLLAAAARRSAAAAELVPGRQTRVLHEAARGVGAPAPRDVAHLAPGRWTRVLQEYPASDPHPPGFDEVQGALGALGALGAGHAHRSKVGSGAADAHRAAVVGAGDGASPYPLDASPAMTASNRTASAPSRLRPAAGQPDRADGASPSAPGTQLPADLAARLAPHVGRDAAGAARLHTDDAADQIAAAHHARALTLGVDIYFARGEYAPGTERGDELLVHELTHVAQARRGELTRAAAKGLASGGTLDPAEAEADLRARLAVIELHAPNAAAPSLAPPQGQPTSDGERSARLAAQQQRLGIAGQAEAPLTVPPAPPATRPEAPVPHPPPQMARPPAPASTGNAYVDALSAPPSKQGLELWAAAGSKAMTQAAADQARFDAALPPMPAVLDGGPAPGRKGGAGGGHAPAPPPARGQTPPAAQPTPTPPAPAVTTAATAARAIQPTATKEQLKTDGQKLIDNLPTTAPDVKTDPGPAPVTDLAGQADPVRSTGDHHHAIGEGARALDAARTKIVTGPGSAQVQPVKLDEKLHVPKEQTTGAMPQLPAVPGMAKLKQWNLPGNALAAFDTVARPKMDAGLAQARARMTEADARRDADRDKAVSDAQGKVKQVHTDADKQQQAKIADTRTQIANHQADTLVKHEAAIKQLDAQSGDRKKATLGKINDRIAADQARAEADYKAAQQQAEAKKRQGEEQARKKKEEAQKKKQDESWWDQATDALCDAIQSIADEIDQVLDAIGQAIGQILDAVKDAACKAIDAARDFVCQALTEFGDWLKSQVDALIGSVFPELAATLDRLIDGAVNLAKAAVTAIADGLKQAVTALCDGLKASLDGIIAAFKAAVQAAATFAQAEVTGNWALVGKMILDGILNALGIDPAAFYALIGEAEDSIEKIVQNPGAFVGHLIDAVKLGFKQFGKNFWTHLKDGLVQWLFGTFASAGITMPASFDIAGIFDLVCQVLGLTWPRLRGKVVKLIGEKNTERLEFVAQYVQALITGGFAGLWEKIQGDLSNLWDMVVGGIRDWLIQAVVMAAIEKIATMWNPAGAIFELIKTAWNVYQWVRENAQRIFGLVQAVVHSISSIVAGNIGGAANFIEASLAKLVPVAISLFADLLGLGGLADKIREIIEKVQEKVDHAIDKLIDRVMKLFKGKDGKDADERTMEEKQAAVSAAAQEGTQLLRQKGATEAIIRSRLPAIQDKYKLVKLELVIDGHDAHKKTGHVRAEINPSAEGNKEEFEIAEDGATGDGSSMPAAEWLARLMTMLNPAEVRQYELMKAKWRTPEDMQRAFHGNLNTAHAEIARIASKKSNAQAASALRAREIERFVDEQKIMQRAEAIRILQELPLDPSAGQINEVAHKIRTLIVSELMAHRNRARYPGAQVHSDIKVWQKQKMTVKEYDEKSRDEKKGLVVRNDASGGMAVYKILTDIDGLVVQPTTGGKAKILRFEQQKGGRWDSHAVAVSQNQTAVDALIAAAKDPSIRLESATGGDITDQIDLASAGGGFEGHGRAGREGVQRVARDRRC